MNIFLGGVKDEEFEFFLSEESLNVVGVVGDVPRLEEHKFIVFSMRDTSDLMTLRDPTILQGMPRVSFFDSEDELKGIQMMSRGDVDRSLDLEDRRIAWRRLVSFWAEQLVRSKADIVYFSHVPHEAELFALWVAAKTKSVSTICGVNIPFLQAKYLAENYCEKPNETFFAKRRNYLQNTEREAVTTKIHSLRLQARWSPPKYVTRYSKTEKGPLTHGFTPPRIGALRPSVSFALKSVNQTIKKVAFWRAKGEGMTLARIAKRIGNSFFYWSLAQNNSLRAKTFSKVSVNKSVNGPYAIFHLHYEPELAVNPLFHGKTQLDALYAFRQLVPEKVRILVAEHPSQYEKERAGFFTGRSSMFYSEIASIPNTLLVSGASISQEERDRAEVVATVTGTAGLEQALRGKIVVVYGCTWYSSLPNVLQSPKEFSEIMQAKSRPLEPLLSDIDKEMESIRLLSGAVVGEKFNLNPIDLKRCFGILASRNS